MGKFFLAIGLPVVILLVGALLIAVGIIPPPGVNSQPAKEGYQLNWQFHSTFYGSNNSWGVVYLKPDFKLVFQDGLWHAENPSGETVMTPGINEEGYTQMFPKDESVYYIRVYNQDLQVWSLQAPAGTTPMRYYMEGRQADARSTFQT